MKEYIERRKKITKTTLKPFTTNGIVKHKKHKIDDVCGSICVSLIFAATFEL